MLQPRLAAATVAAFLACSLGRAAAWPAVQSDLAPDPAVHWGVLANGLRYAVRHNAEPKGRVSIRLMVAVGSIEERESERGIAHFTEHMAYRGTRQHPDGSMTSELQRLGVGFGPDSSAFTFWDHTIYQLELPDNSDATLREGLGVFSEYAGDITFDPALIERERGVVLNERDTRDTPDARSGEANLELLWPDSVQVRRRPIGLAENIRHFTREQFVAFYDAWYRPERMAVVVVGDIDPKAAERLVASVMGGLKARAPARAGPIHSVPEKSGAPTICVFEDSGLTGVTCRLEHPLSDPVSPDTHERRVRQMRRAMAFYILQKRVAKLAKTSEGKVVVADAGVTGMLEGWSVASFGATGNMNDWKGFMAKMEQEQRRAYQFGFTAAEMEVTKAGFATSYANAVRTSDSWHSDWLSTRLANTMLEGSVFTTPASYQKDIEADLAATTAEECRQEYRRAWTAQSQHVFVSANPIFKVTAKDIAGMLNASRATAVTRPSEQASVAFAYTDFGPPGKIVSSQYAKDLDVHQAQLSNGVRFNFKPTPFEAGTVIIALRVGTGILSEPRDKPGLDLLANGLVSYGGLGRHSVEDLQDALAGHSLSIDFSVGTDALEFYGRCEPKELGLCLRLIAAYLTDAGYREDTLPQVRANMNSMYSSLAASPAGPIQMSAPRILSGGDLRFGTATPGEFSQRTIKELKEWVDPQLKHGPIELGIAGDTTWEDASAAVASTLGALPQRDERDTALDLQQLRLRGRPGMPLYLFTTAPSLRLVALSRFCPVLDLGDMHMDRRCRFLAALLTERMRVRLRIELGASYGFDAAFVSYTGFPELSYFSVSTTVSSELAERANQLLADEIESLHRGNISEDEFERVKQPFVSKRAEDLRDNSYWSYTVLRDSQEFPERLDEARDRQADCASITRAEIADLTDRYFKPERWFQFTAYPQVSTTFQKPTLQAFK